MHVGLCVCFVCVHVSLRILVVDEIAIDADGPIYE